MLTFLQSQLGNTSGKGVVDLCLDYSLVSDLHPAKFTEISGLELFPDLEELSIAMQNLSSATGLKHLAHLRVLDLSHNALEKLDEIVSLTGLEFLDISHNEVESLDGIAHLERLENLQAGFNLLDTVAPLAGLQQLMVLVLNGNRAIQQLDGLPPSLIELHLAKCFIHDFSALTRLARLQLLTVSPGSMYGLEVLTELPMLDALHIQATRMHGRLAIPPLNSLTRLKITNAQQILSLNTSAEMPQLEQLEIHHSPLSQPPELGHFPNLKVLEIKFSPLKNLDGIAELEHLELLKLEGSQMPQKALLALQNARPALEIQF